MSKPLYSTCPPIEQAMIAAAAEYDLVWKFEPEPDGSTGRHERSLLAAVRAVLKTIRDDSAFTVINYDPKSGPPPAGWLQGVKPLNEEEQRRLDRMAALPCCFTYGIADTQFLLSLAERLPREPRKKTLGQVLWESEQPTPRVGLWSYEAASEGYRAKYEERARAVIDEHKKREAAGG